MLKKYWKTGCNLLIILLAAVLLLCACLQSRQATPASCRRLDFTGEYSHNGGAWLPLDEQTSLSSLTGGLALRGRFSTDVPEGRTLLLYLNHLTYSFSVNSRQIAASSALQTAHTADTCGASWAEVVCPAITATDTVEIHLSNPHRFGNSAAYTQFLDNIYAGSAASLGHTLSFPSILYRSVGIVVSILAVAVLGAALVLTLMHSSSAYCLWSMGIVALGMGGCMFMSAPDISLLFNSPVFATYAIPLCLVVTALQLNGFLAEHLKSPSKAVASALLGIQCAALAAMLLLVLLGKALLYDLMLPWSIMQFVLCIILAGCCICEWRALRSFRDWALPAAFLLLLCLAAEIPLSLLPPFPHGILLTGVFLVLFLLLLIRSIRAAAALRQKTGQIEDLQNELQNNRIMMAMNQIRTHFIFNVLNAISGMCKYDPEKADRTMVRFSRYLRTNIDIMQADAPISFSAALRHVEDYIVLEQIRFGDKLRFITDITVEDFMLPPLILQPLVENAIKHGISVKPNGGTITLRTRSEKGNFLIFIEDDGVGFDPSAAGSEHSVGLKNVRFRLRHMVNGSLSIDSTPGHGTVYTISIPQKEASPCM